MVKEEGFRRPGRPLDQSFQFCECRYPVWKGRRLELLWLLLDNRLHGHYISFVKK